MRSLSSRLGLSADDLLDPLPQLSPAAAQAAACWSFCDGWAPERWPAFAAFHQVRDWAAHVELMQAMRAKYRKHEEAAAGHHHHD